MVFKGKFKGILCLPVTPFVKGGEGVDEEAYRRIIDIIIEDGADALVPVGATGEFLYLLHEERKRVIDITVDQANGRIPVIAGTGALSTMEARMFTQYAKDVGCEGVLLSHPMMLRHNDHETYAHFEHIASKVDEPIILYNNPQFGASISPSVVTRLAENFDNIVGYKEDDFFSLRYNDIICRTRDKLGIYTGSPSAYLAFLVQGAAGALIAEFQAFPHIMLGIKNAWEAKDMKKALHYHELVVKMFNIIDANFGTASFWGRYKAIWRLRGVDMELDVRAPCTPVTPEQLEKAAPEFMKLDIEKTWFRG
jgi:4-hydroxy-tetrahydrodipicolinate synthase